MRRIQPCQLKKYWYWLELLILPGTTDTGWNYWYRLELLTLAGTTDTDWNCWYWLESPFTVAVVCAGESIPHLFVTSNRCIIFQIKLVWSAILLFACDNPAILLMFSVDRAVQKYDFRLVINETPSKWQPLNSHTMAPTRVCGRMGRMYTCSPRQSSRVLTDSTHAVQVNYIHLCKRQ
jgi:hypothetical protein